MLYNYNRYFDDSFRFIQILRVKKFHNIDITLNFFPNEKPFFVLVDNPESTEEKDLIKMIEQINDVNILTFENKMEIKSYIDILKKTNLYIFFDSSEDKKDFFGVYGILWNYKHNLNSTFYDLNSRVLTTIEGKKLLTQYYKYSLSEISTEKLIYLFYKGTLPDTYLNTLINSKNKNKELIVELIKLFVKYRKFYYQYIKIKLLLLKFSTN